MSSLRRTFLKTHSHTATNSSRTGGIVFDKNLCFRFRQLDEKQIQSICQRFASGEGGWNSTPKPASIVVVGTSMVVVFIELSVSHSPPNRSRSTWMPRVLWLRPPFARVVNLSHVSLEIGKDKILSTSSGTVKVFRV